MRPDPIPKPAGAPDLGAPALLKEVFMGKYKVCVYAICKNEEQFVDRWMDSMSEADQVVVLDTGSEDGTVERLDRKSVV